jgi:putative peptidoglycan lipid II flippase
LLLKSTIQVTLFSFLGVLLGFVSQLVVAYFFGATPSRDAYFAAAVIPTYLTALFVGSVGSIFMSAYMAHQTQRTRTDTVLFVSRVVNVCGVLLSGLVVLGIIFADDVVAVSAPGFSGGQHVLAVTLLRIVLPSTLFLSLSSLLTTIYQAQGKFLLAALVPVLGILVTLSVVLVFSRILGIVSLAYGSLASSIFNFLALSPMILKRGQYRPNFALDREVRSIFAVSGPLFLTGIFYRSTSIFERMIASTLGPGSISYLGYANQFLASLTGIAASGIATTIFPVMSKQWELRDLTGVQELFAKGVRTVLVVTLPIAAIFLVQGQPIVRILLERGAFDAGATTAVSKCLAVMMVAFVSLSSGTLIARGFYLTQETKKFSLLVTSEMVIYLAAGYFLSKYVSYLGLAAALSISSLYTATVGTLMLRRVFGGLDGATMLRDFGRILCAAVVLGVTALLVRFLLQDLLNELWSVGLAIAAGTSAYAIFVTCVMPIPDAVRLKDRILRPIADRLRPSSQKPT